MFVAFQSMIHWQNPRTQDKVKEILWGGWLDTHLTIVLRNHGRLMMDGTASSMSGCVLMKFRVSSGSSLEVAYLSKDDEPAQQPGLKMRQRVGLGRWGEELFHAFWQILWMNGFSKQLAWRRLCRRQQRGRWTMQNGTKYNMLRFPLDRLLILWRSLSWDSSASSPGSLASFQMCKQTPVNRDGAGTEWVSVVGGRASQGCFLLSVNLIQT